MRNRLLTPIGLTWVLLLLAASTRGEENPSLYSDAKTWATLPHPDQKPAFGDAKPGDGDGFLGAFDPPLPERVRAGWFGEFGAAVLSPHFAGNRSSNLFVPLFASTFPTLEAVDIQRAYGPEFAFGFRREGVASLSLRYQGIYAEKSSTRIIQPVFPFDLTNIGVPIDQIITLNSPQSARYRTRFRNHTADLILSTDTMSVAPRWDFKLAGGLRAASFFLEDRGDSKLMSQSARNTFDGLGPLLGIDVNRQILTQDDGFLAWIHARVEGSYVFGDAVQTLQESFVAPVTAIPPSRVRSTEDQQAPRIAGEIGFSFADLPTHHIRGTVGYRFDRWFHVGKSGGSDFDLVLQGAFLRVEWNY